MHNLPKNGGKQLAYTFGIVCLVVLMVFNPTWFPNQEAFELIRHNFVGWMPGSSWGVFVQRRMWVCVTKSQHVQLFVYCFQLCF